MITNVQLVTEGKLASAVVLDFSKPMAPATVGNINNYRILSNPHILSHINPLLGAGLAPPWSETVKTRSFPLATATYDPSTSRVTLTLTRPVKASSLYEITSAYPLAGHELTDLEGRQLALAQNGTGGLGEGLLVSTGAFTIPIHPGATPFAVNRLLNYTT
jgi:hypothetical protein